DQAPPPRVTLRPSLHDALPICPHATMPLAGKAASVVTLHDATCFTEPVLHSAVKVRFFRSWTRLSLRRADRCVVPSEATARELTAVASADPERLSVIPHGVDTDSFHPPSPEEIAEARAAAGLGEQPYVAFLGALEPRKNVPALIRGFVQAVRDRADPPALALAGPPGWDDR